MKTKHKIKAAMLAFASSMLLSNAFAQVPLSFNVENRGADCNVSPGGMTASTVELPNPFEWTNGGLISTFDDWTCRRNEIKSEIEEYEIGPKPAPSTCEVSASYSNETLSVKITTSSGSITLQSSCKVPSGTGPHPVVIGMASGEGSLSGTFSNCIQVAFMHDQVVKNDHMSSTQWQSDPFYKVYPELYGKIGNYNAWSWGISRIIDGLEQVKDQINADLGRIAVTGCSYAGKMALFAGAFDERIALTIAQESGGGGVTAWRVSQNYLNTTGQDLEKIDNTNYGWFKSSMKNLDPFKLPHDHHELIAMIAPRAFLALGNGDYNDWLGDGSGYISCVAAREVWKSMGVEDRFGMDFSGGHQHCQASTTQKNSAGAFVEKFLKNGDSNTNIEIKPSSQRWNTDVTPFIKFETPELEFKQGVPKATINASSSIEKGESITISVDVEDSDNNVSSIEVFVNGTSIGESTTAPYTVEWTATEVGEVEISAVVKDPDNEVTSKATINVMAPAVIGTITATVKGTYGGEEVAIVVDGEELDSWTVSEIDEWEDFSVEGNVNGVIQVHFLNDDNQSVGRDLVVDYITVNGKKYEAEDQATNTGYWNGSDCGGSEQEELNCTGYIEFVVDPSGPIEDLCLNNPNKIAPGVCGCDIDDIDTDKDGLMDCEDPCPYDDQDMCGSETISLSKGWNLIGSTLEGTTPLEDAFTDIWEYVECIKDLDAFYEKDYSDFLNLLEGIDWGRGYFIKVSQDCEIDW